MFTINNDVFPTERIQQKIRRTRKEFNEKEKKVLNALKKESNWNPCITKISKETNISTSTIHDIIKRLKVKND